jgi:hypothetical protein
MNKRVALLLIVVLAVSSLIAIKPARAEASIPKPSVPEFTLKFVEHPYEVPPTTMIDPYTGENVTIQAGYRVQNRSIEVIIKNQPFTPYEDSNGNSIDLYYNVRSKGHYGDNWYYYPYYFRALPIIAMDNDYTILSFGLDGHKDDQYSFGLGDLSAGSQVDFQVQASIGYYSNPLYEITLEYNVFTGETSGWSNTQTLTVSASSTPEIPEFPSWIILPLLIIVAIGVGLLLYFKKRNRQAPRASPDKPETTRVDNK